MANEYAVDAHALIWFLEGNPRLSANALAAMQDPTSVLHLPIIALAEACWAVDRGRTGIASVPTLLAGVDADPRIAVVPLDRAILDRSLTLSAAWIAMAYLPEVDGSACKTDNGTMEILGRVQNGVVVLEGGATLPEGTLVTVLCDRVRIWHEPGKKNRVAFPLVRSRLPGSLHLTNERITEILQEEDFAGFQKSVGQSKV